ncbi:hypothetical protein [Sphingomonas sp.]|jgi:hypothetical protein|uniref:hypothetical protein n=1 Tax=Sphingomonas sp. TaxID=28214 RepID=UPI002D7EAFFA|nr:hypothetical protein [Sphingomonas sp.]HEU0043045.1 hypothetical protein [Sphingomonas sp.]
MQMSGKVALAAITLLVCTPAAAQQVEGPPQPPAGAVASLRLPARDAAGAFATPNSGLTSAETVWHLRTALNVAALGCRGTGEAELVAAYNALLAAERQVLAVASDATTSVYRARHGAGWQARYDDAMTRLYNFWAQPAAQAAFCREADTVLRDAATVEPSDFAGFAATALPRLEAPFLALFTEVESYRAALAQWQAQRAPAVQVAALPGGSMQTAMDAAPVVAFAEQPSLQMAALQASGPASE